MESKKSTEMIPILDSIPAGIILYDTDEKLLWLNQTAKNLFRFKTGNVAGFHRKEIIDSRIAPFVQRGKNPVSRVLATIRHHSESPLRFPMRMVSNTLFWVTYAGIPRASWNSSNFNIDIFLVDYENDIESEQITIIQNQIRSLFEHPPDAYVILDRSGGIVHQSPQIESITGFDEDDCSGRRFQIAPYITRVQMVEIARMIDQFRRGARTSPIEMTLLCKGGGSIEAEVFIPPLALEDGMLLVGFNLLHATDYEMNEAPRQTHLDILLSAATEFAEAPQNCDLYALAEKYLRLLLPESGVIVSSIDETEKRLTIRSLSGDQHLKTIVNREFGSDIIGMTMEIPADAYEEMLSGKLIEIEGIEQLTFGNIREESARAFEEEAGISRIFGIGFVRQEHLYGNAIIISDNDRGLIEAMAIETLARQLSVAFQKQQLMHALADSEKFHRNIINHTLDGIIIQDFEGRLLLANDAALRMFDLTDTDVIGSNTLDFIAPSSRKRVIKDLKNVFQGKGGYLSVYQALSSTGRSFWIEGLGTKIIYGDKPVNLVSIREVTERLVAEERLRTEHELSLALVNSGTFDDVLSSSLSAALKISGMDSGGIFCVEPDSGDLVLMHHSGLGEEFIGHNSRLSPDSAMGKVILAGKENFRGYDAFEKEYQAKRVCEGLEAGLDIPITSHGSVIGCYNLASHDTATIPENCRQDLRTIAAQVGNAIMRLKVENELHESEEKYRELVEKANTIILRIDTNGKITFFNEFAEHFFGFSNNEVVGRDIVSTIIPQTDLKGRNLRDVARDMIEHPEQYSEIESEAVRKDGSRVWISWRNHPFYHEDGNVAGFLSVGNDITGRRRIEQELRHSQQQYLSTLNALQHGVYVIDTDLRIVFLNSYFSTWCSDLGLVLSEDPAGKPVNEVFKFLSPAVIDEYRRVFETGIALTTEEKIIFGDSEVFTKTTKIPIIRNGEVDVVVTFVRDITKERQSEKALEESEKAYRSTIDAMADPIFVIDRTFSITLLNRAFVHMFERMGFETGVLGRSLEDAIPVIFGRLKPFYQLAFESGEVMHIEETLRFGENEYIYNIRIIPVFNGGEVIQAVTVIRDVTAERNFEKMRYEAFVQIEKNMEQFAILNDHIRNPLQAIVGLTDLQGGEMADKIFDCALEIDDIIKRLDISWLESQKISEFLRKHYGHSNQE